MESCSCQILAYISKPIAESLFSLLLICIMLNSDNPHGDLLEVGGMSIRNPLVDGGLYKRSLFEGRGLTESLPIF